MQSQATTANKATGKLFVMGAVGAFALVVLLSFSGNKQSQAYSNEQLLPMQNAQVAFREVQLQDSYRKTQKVYGLLESAQQADIGFELGGVIASILVQEGQNVVAGQPLAVLDMQRLRAQQKQISAAINKAQADAKLARLSAQRVRELVAAKLEPEQKLDEAQAALDAAEALVTEVTARDYTLQVELEKSTLLAPFDGQVVSQIVDAGTVVSTGQAVFSLHAQAELEARFGLPSNTAYALQLNRNYPLEVNSIAIDAQLQSISKVRNQATRTLDAVFRIAEQSATSKSVLPGDLALLEVSSQVPKLGVWVPLSALANGVRGMWTVYVLAPTEDAYYQVQSRVVAVEYMNEKNAYVTGALSNGDKLILNGIARLTPGQRVNNAQALAAQGE